MGKLAVGIIALVVGFIIGAFGAFTVGGGAMVGVGVATGLSTGVCMTVEAAEDLGLMTAEQVDQVLARAAANISSGEEAAESAEVVGSAAECAKLMADFRAQQS